MSKKLHDFILLDRSGSMSDKWSETLSSVNVYVKELGKNENTKDTKITVVAFDSHAGLQFDVVRDAREIDKWVDISDVEVSPRGGTPLFDATIRLVSLAEKENPDNCCIVIMTDGMENSSKEVNQTQAKAALDRLRTKGWQVIFLGANFDNTQQARNLGTMPDQMIQSSTANLSATMSMTAGLRASYASSGVGMAYTTEDIEKAK
jgi:Mg-chelatase subunit ChlD